MMMGRIEGATRVLGRSQGFLALPIRDVPIQIPQSKDITNEMISAWFPTPAELEALQKGAAVYVSLLGTDHPPILVEVGPIPEPISEADPRQIDMFPKEES